MLVLSAVAIVGTILFPIIAVAISLMRAGAPPDAEDGSEA